MPSRWKITKNSVSRKIVSYQRKMTKEADIEVPVRETFEEVWNKEPWWYRLVANKDAAKRWYITGWADSTTYINKLLQKKL